MECRLAKAQCLQLEAKSEFLVPLLIWQSHILSHRAEENKAEEFSEDLLLKGENARKPTKGKRLEICYPCAVGGVWSLSRASNKLHVTTAWCSQHTHGYRIQGLSETVLCSKEQYPSKGEERI